MNRIRLLASVTVLVFALSTAAQQPTTAPDVHAAATSPVEQHLKVISEKLTLTADQQDKARPILQEMHDSSQKLDDDQTLTPDQRQAAMHPVFMKADKQLREILTDDQKKKLDDLEAQMHPAPPAGSTANPPASQPN
jgi:Spy/CpxP family protein refolding chaperone